VTVRDAINGLLDDVSELNARAAELENEVDTIHDQLTSAVASGADDVQVAKLAALRQEPAFELARIYVRIDAARRELAA
jgi:hypothetical protein